MIRGVIIDLDGTIIDSEEALYQYYINFLKQFGKEGSREEFKSLHRPLKEVAAYLEAKYQIPSSYESYIKGLENITPNLMPGVLSFLHMAKLNRLKLVLATSAHKDYADRILQAHNLDVFDFKLYETSNKWEEGLKVLNLARDEVLYLDDQHETVNWDKWKQHVLDINYQTLFKGEKLAVEIVPLPDNLRLSDDEKNQVETVWKNAIQENPTLFNGNILHFLEIKNNTLVGCFIEYKNFLASFRGVKLKYRCVCLSGITTFENKLLIAERSPQVSQYPHYWELIPAGGFDDSSDNWEDHIYKELEEEAHIPRENVAFLKCHSIIFDHLDNIIEIVAKVELSKPDFSPSDETTNVKFYDSKDEFLPFVPFSHYLIKEVHPGR